MKALFEGKVFCSVDLETTGLDESLHDIWSISCFAFDWKSYEMFDCVIDRSISVWSDTAKKFFNSTKNKKLIHPMEARASFMEWLDYYEKKFILVGYNPNFEFKFLVKWLGKENFDKHFAYYSIDVKSLIIFAKLLGKYKGGHHLDEVTQYFELPHINHSSKDDAYKTKIIFEKLLQMF